MLDVVALGELLIDFTCVSTDADGYPTMAAHPGGAPANFLAALAKFGAKTALIGKVGADTFGERLKDTLRKANIDTRGIVTDERVFTTLAFVTLDERGNREFSFARKPGADTCLCQEDIDRTLIASARVLHFGTLSLTDEPAASATRSAVEYAQAAGRLITFDPNLRKPLWRDLERERECMLWGLQHADIVKLSDDEADFLFDMDAQSAASHILRNFGVKLVFVTCGSHGCCYENANARGLVPGISGISTIDTTGAGDIFGGSALWWLLQLGKLPEQLSKEELEDAASFACASAGISTTRSGGISSVPEYDEVLSALKRRA